MKREIMRIWVILPVLLLAVFACKTADNEEPRTISVEGIADIQIPADRVAVYLAVVTRNIDPQKAQRQNDEKVKSVLEFLQSLSIPSTDISTGYVSLDRREAELEDKPPVFLDYEAKNEIRILLKEMGIYDQLITGLLQSGVNRIDGIIFQSSKARETQKQARIDAIRAAREKAEYLAGELRQKVGEPLTIELDEGDRSAAYSNTYHLALPADTQSNQSIAPATLTIRSQVKVKFRLTGE